MANVTHHETGRREDHGSMPIRDETRLLRAMPPTFEACEISRSELSDGRNSGWGWSFPRDRMKECEPPADAGFAPRTRQRGGGYAFLLPPGSAAAPPDAARMPGVRCAPRTGRRRSRRSRNQLRAPVLHLRYLLGRMPAGNGKGGIALIAACHGLYD